MNCYNFIIQTKQQKRAFSEALNFNGGNDAFRFELLVKKYIFDLFPPSVDKICGLIEQLGISV